ncbi:helix-turn-helix domain-containing protein [Enterococcus sp. LJL120]
MLSEALLIKWNRVCMGKSQSQMAKEFFISPSYLSKIENLEQPPSQEIVISLFDILDLNNLRIGYQQDNQSKSLQKFQNAPLNKMLYYFAEYKKECKNSIERLTLELIRFDCEVFNNSVDFLRQKHDFLKTAIQHLEHLDESEERNNLLFVLLRSLIYLNVQLENFTTAIAMIKKLKLLIETFFPKEINELNGQLTNQLMLLYNIGNYEAAFFESDKLLNNPRFIETARIEYISAIWMVKCYCEVHYNFWNAAKRSLAQFFALESTDMTIIFSVRILSVQVYYNLNEIHKAKTIAMDIYNELMVLADDRAFIRSFGEIIFELCLFFLYTKRIDLYTKLFDIADYEVVATKRYPIHLACKIIELYYSGEYDRMIDLFQIYRSENEPYRKVSAKTMITVCNLVSEYYDSVKQYKNAAEVRKIGLDYQKGLLR